MNAIEELKEYFAEIMRLHYIQVILGWDQEVNMQNYKSLEGRSKQVSLLEKLIHKRVTSEKVGKLIKEAEELTDLNEIESAMLREITREYNLATKLPEKLVTEIAETSILAAKDWREARAKSDFSIFQNILEKSVELQKEKARRLETHPDMYSTLIDLYEPDATYDWISNVFNPIKPKLIDFVKKLNSSSDKPDDSILRKNYDPDKQFELSFEIIKKLNYDLGYGRQDRSTHPFTSSLASMDTRITTRTSEDYLNECILGTIHECGHALYEMGIKKELYDTILCNGTSMGIHESQSRMWENFVGRSKEFWMYWYPTFQKYFPENLKDYPMQEFYRAVNTVQPSFIRVNADEVTYGLHIILRFELEKELIEGKIQVKELPDLWNSKFEELLRIIPPNDAQGVLQDIHWSMGSIGYFPTYFLGNLYGAQIYQDALKKLPHLPEDYRKGEFSNLLNYLRENVHQHGMIYRADDLIKRITGEPLNSDYFMKYLEKKFYPIY
ncbi:MAG: carboxypeptidase M32, partial [Candidatus Lokiarchaeota archaeon]|nr:carboxypeptidase M32 [Candidatus Lokiarchaeota archaeon]